MTIYFIYFQKWYDEFLEIFKDLTHLSLFLELHFLLLSISTIILFIWFIVPYFYLAEHMKRMGYTETEASFVISVIGFTNTVGMVSNLKKKYHKHLQICILYTSRKVFYNVFECDTS